MYIYVGLFQQVWLIIAVGGHGEINDTKERPFQNLINISVVWLWLDDAMCRAAPGQ